MIPLSVYFLLLFFRLLERNLFYFKSIDMTRLSIMCVHYHPEYCDLHFKRFKLVLITNAFLFIKVKWVKRILNYCCWVLLIEKLEMKRIGRKATLYTLPLLEYNENVLSVWLNFFCFIKDWFNHKMENRMIFILFSWENRF